MEREPHEHQRHISRCFSRQQGQPKNEGMERSPGSGPADKGTGWNCSVESVGRKTPGRDRCHGRTAWQNQEDHSTRDRRHKQRHGSLYGRPSGIKRGRRKAFRKSSALHNIPWRSRGGNAGLADTWRLICDSARNVGFILPAAPWFTAPTPMASSNVRSGSKGDIAVGGYDVRLAPESGYWPTQFMSTRPSLFIRPGLSP